MKLQVFIIRGVPGSGKSTLIKQIIESDCNGKGYIYSTDDFFLVDGKYCFESHLLGTAHDWNLVRAYNAMQTSKSPIFIDNTHTQKWEAKLYVQFALEFGYCIQIMEPTTSWWIERNTIELEKKNRHDVSQRQIDTMIKRWEPDFDISSILMSQIPVFKTCKHRHVIFVRGVATSGKWNTIHALMIKYKGGFMLDPLDYFRYEDSIGVDETLMNNARIWNTLRTKSLFEKHLSPILVCDTFRFKEDLKELMSLALNHGYTNQIVNVFHSNIENEWDRLEENCFELITS